MPRRGEIWRVNFDPSIGAEIQKTRPSIVVSDDAVLVVNHGIGRLPVRIVVPITGWQPAFQKAQWFVRLLPTIDNGLTKESGADALQLRSISEQRFVGQVGFITEKELQQVVKAINICIGGV